MSFNVFVREEKRKLPVSRAELEKIASSAFQITGNEESDISLVVCDDERITELNETYTGSRGPTDVLAFSMREGKSIASAGMILGDVVISIDKAAQQAAELGETLQEEFLILFVHGLLHLLGFDHRNRREKSEMHEYTEKIVMRSGNAV